MFDYFMFVHVADVCSLFVSLSLVNKQFFILILHSIFQVKCNQFEFIIRC